MFLTLLIDNKGHWEFPQQFVIINFHSAIIINNYGMFQFKFVIDAWFLRNFLWLKEKTFPQG